MSHITPLALRHIDSRAGRAPLHDVCRRFTAHLTREELRTVIARSTPSIEAAICAVELHRRGEKS